MTYTPTPTALRPVTLHLRDSAGEVIGSFAARLIPGNRTESLMSGTWAITHALGSPAGGTHTEVAFVDGTCGTRDLDGDGSFRDPERDAIAEQIVRAVANALYSGTWAFTYRPEQVEDHVLRYGSILRERVEVTAVEVWA
jgi:hypothetical protein